VQAFCWRQHAPTCDFVLRVVVHGGAEPLWQRPRLSVAISALVLLCAAACPGLAAGALQWRYILQRRPTTWDI
jgi:hypothetical protein